MKLIQRIRRWWPWISKRRADCERIAYGVDRAQQAAAEARLERDMWRRTAELFRAEFKKVDR